MEIVKPAVCAWVDARVSCVRGGVCVDPTDRQARL